MNIVFVITSASPVGGAHVYVLNLCNALKHAGHKIHVLVGGDGLFIDQLQGSEIPFTKLHWLRREIRPFIDMRALKEIRKNINILSPDLVSTHSSKAGILGRLASYLENVPAVHTAHGWTFSEGRPWIERYILKYVEKIAAYYSKRIITVCESDRELALRYGIGKADQLITIHNAMPPIDGSLFASPACKPPRLVMTARFSEQKDYWTLFKSLALLKDFEWETDLVGDGPLFNDAKKLIIKLGLEKRVHFLGHASNVAEILKQAQIFTLISNWEGFPLSILEAMRAGLPVIATDVGGVREAVIDGENGFLVQKHDVRQLGDLLKKLFLDSNLRMEMGLAGRRRYLKYFSYDGLLAQTISVYQDALM